MSVDATTSIRAQRRAEVSQALERAALALFARYGYHNVTVAEVAAEAGVTSRTLFRHYPTKEDLLLALPRRTAYQLLVELQALEPTGNDPVRKVWQLLVDLSTNRRPSAKVLRLWARATADCPEALARMRGERSALLEPVLADYFAESLGIDPHADPRPRVLAASVHAAERAVIAQWAESGGVPELSHLFEEAFSATPRLERRSPVAKRRTRANR